MRISLHVLWFIVSASDAMACILTAVYCFRTGKRFGKYMGWMMVGISVEAIIAASSLILFWMVEVEVAPAFAIARTIGRSIKAISAWAFCAYVFYFINGDNDIEHTRSPDK